MYTKANNKNNKNLELRDDLFCRFCNKQCKNLNSLKQHEIRCKNNPARIVSYDTLSNKGWAKGLTKDTDCRIAKLSENLKKYYETNPGTFTNHTHTEEAKRKQSIAQLNIDHANHNRYSWCKKGWYDGIFFMSSYELAYYIYNRDNLPETNIKRCDKSFYYEYNGKLHRYTPDFIINNNQIIEIKGKEFEKDLIKYSVVPGIIVLYYKDIKHMILYVKNTYKVKNVWDLYDAD